MNNILSIIKKEFFRFFKDKRMVLTTIILPGLMIYVLYSIIGSSLSGFFGTSEDYSYKVYIYNESVYMTNLRNTIDDELEKNNVNVKSDITKDPEISVMDSIELIKNKDIDLVIVYPPDFENFSGADNILKFYYNSTNNNSLNAYNYYTEYFNAIEQSITNAFDINTDMTDIYDQASEQEKSGQIFSMMLPMLLLIFMFSGCISVAPESIAGEKERGTIATLLVTPVTRRDLAIGKLVSLSMISLLSGLSSFLGTMFSLPKLMGEDMGISTNVYGITEYIWLLLIILSTVLLFTAIISIISAYAKSVKEATSLITPVMIILTVISISSMYSNGAATNHLLYMLPIFNCLEVMISILSFEINVLNVIITLLTNLVVTAGLIVCLAKMFNSEKIMFNK